MKLRPAPIASVALLALAACVKRPPPPPPPAPRDPVAETVAAARKGVDVLLEEQTELYWKNWVYGDELDLARTWAAHDALFSMETLTRVRQAIVQAQEPARLRALRYLESYLAGEMLARETAEVDQKLAAADAALTFTFDGRESPARQLDALLALEPDAARRAALEKAAAPQLAKLAPLVAEKLARLDAATRKLGYNGALSFATDLRAGDLVELAHEAEAVLAGSDALYRALAGELAQSDLGMPLEQLRRRDDVRLYARRPGDDAAFPASRLVPDAEAALAGFGLDLGAQTNVLVDAEARPKKNPRPIALAVEPPTDVRVSVVPLGGEEDCRSYFHELGHAELSAHVAASADVAFRRLGPAAVPEAYGLLFEGIVEDPAWLAGRPGVTDPRARARARAARHLYQARRAAAQLLFELARAKPGADAKALYKSIFARAYAHPVDDDEAARWMLEADPLLESADDLRARLLEAQLEAWLTRQAGGPWWKSKGSGAALAKLWESGTRDAPIELSRALGEGRLDGGALEAWVKARAGL